MNFSGRVFSGLVAAVLGGCAASPRDDFFGTFYEPGNEYSFRGQKVLILYATDEKLREQSLSENESIRWPSLKSPELIEDLTKKLQERGAYVSFLPVFSDELELTLRLCQYDRNWDALLITYTEFEPSAINGENMDSVYLPMLHDNRMVIGKLGVMDSIIPLNNFSNSSKKSIKPRFTGNEREIF